MSCNNKIQGKSSIGDKTQIIHRQRVEPYIIYKHNTRHIHSQSMLGTLLRAVQRKPQEEEEIKHNSSPKQDPEKDEKVQNILEEINKATDKKEEKQSEKKEQIEKRTNIKTLERGPEYEQYYCL